LVVADTEGDNRRNTYAVVFFFLKLEIRKKTYDKIEQQFF